MSITVPPAVNAKTRQKHDYPSRAHRSSYARRSAAERANSTIKDPASNDVAPGWCRLMGLVPMTLMLACVLVVRNQRVLASFAARQPTTNDAWPRASRPRRGGVGEGRSQIWSAPPPTHRRDRQGSSGTSASLDLTRSYGGNEALRAAQGGHNRLLEPNVKIGEV